MNDLAARAEAERAAKERAENDHVRLHQALQLLGHSLDSALHRIDMLEAENRMSLAPMRGKSFEERLREENERSIAAKQTLPS